MTADPNADLRDLDEAEREHWRIDGDREATWALRKVAASHAEQDRINGLYAAELDRLNQWRAEALAGPRRDEEFFTSHLVGYRHRLEAENEALPKSYRLPGGRLTRRQGSVSIDVRDESEFCTWALDNAADLVRVSPARSALAKLAKADDGTIVSPDGEPVPGVAWVRGEDSYGVTLDRAADVPDSEGEAA